MALSSETSVWFTGSVVVDARFTTAHKTEGVELPQLIAVGAEPVPGIVMPLVLKTHRDTVVGETGTEILVPISPGSKDHSQTRTSVT